MKVSSFALFSFMMGLLHLSKAIVASPNDLIVTDFKRATSEMGVNVAKDASFDCWLDSLNKLEIQLFSNDEAYGGTRINVDGVKLSPGGNFCSYMRSGSGHYSDILAFELTRCEYEKFNEPLPTECGTNNDTSFRNCMSSLPKNTWLAVWTSFTQYKLSAYNICTKLTDELMLHRQKEAAYHLKKTMFDMEGKMDQVLLKADTQIEDTINLIRTNVEDMKHDMKEDVKGMINQEMEHVQHLHEDMKSALSKADDKLREATRKLEEHFQNALAEFYQTSGLKALVNFTGNINSGSFISSSNKFWTNLITISRSLVVLTAIMFLTRSRRIQRARPLITFLIAFESIIELNLNHLTSVGQLEVIKRNRMIHSFRFCDFMVYFVIMTITFLTSFFPKRDVRNQTNRGMMTECRSTSTNINTQIEQSAPSSSMMDDALDRIRAEMQHDQETRRRETEELIKNFNWSLQQQRLQEERFRAKQHQHLQQHQEQQQRRYNNCSYSTNNNSVDTPRALNPTLNPRPRSSPRPSTLSSSLLLSSLVPPPPFPSFVIPRDTLVGTRQRLEFSSENDSYDEVLFEEYDTCSEGEGAGVGARQSFITSAAHVNDEQEFTPLITLNGGGVGDTLNVRVGSMGQRKDRVPAKGKLDKKRKALDTNLQEDESEQNEFERAEKKRKNHH